MANCQNQAEVYIKVKVQERSPWLLLKQNIVPTLPEIVQNERFLMDSTKRGQK